MESVGDQARAAHDGLAMPGELAAAGMVVADHLDAEAAALAHGLAGAVILAALAVRPGGRRIVLQKGHDIDIGGPLSALLAVTGAPVHEIGSIDRATPDELEAALDEAAAAVVYVADERLQNGGLIGLPDFRWIARQHGVPAIVIAPDTDNWEGLLDAGADLLVLDAASALDGPPVGIVAGLAEPVAAAATAQARGLGHALRPTRSSVQALLNVLSEPARSPSV